MENPMQETISRNRKNRRNKRSFGKIWEDSQNPLELGDKKYNNIALPDMYAPELFVSDPLTEIMLI